MANNVKLLVVDDNPMVLAMLQQALTPLARVATATDAADALLKAVDDAPDLLGAITECPGWTDASWSRNSRAGRRLPIFLRC